MRAHACRLAPAVAACTAALLLGAAEVRAQTLTCSGGIYRIERRLFFQSGPAQHTHEQTGMALGGAGAARLGPLRVGIGGWMATLKGNVADSLNPDVKVRTTAISAQAALGPAAAVGVVYEVRRFDGDAGVTTWRLMGGSAHLEPALGLPGLRAVADVAVLPVSSVRPGPKLNMAVQVTGGLVFAPSDGKLEIQLAYRFERYDIAATNQGGERYEQFSGIVATAGLRFGR